MTIQVVKPRIRGFIGTNAHPIGCRKNVQNQIDYIKESVTPKQIDFNVLIVGATGGYGLASRIALTWIYSAKSIGVFFERPPDAKRTATAGYYDSVAFHQLAREKGLFAESINGDAFSNDVKRDTINRIKRNIGKIDLLVYSIAAPRRVHPRTGVEHRSVLKPIGQSYSGKTIDLQRETVTQIAVEPANEQEISDTTAVMGGEDLELWIDALLAENLLASESTVVAYSYIGPELTWPIYRSGTIGRAKENLANSINNLDRQLSNKLGGRAFISVNKAVITQASAAIPVVPLYISVLYDIMNAKAINEDPIAQMARLFSEHLGPNQTPTLDADRLIRLDDRELRPDVTDEVMRRWEKINTDNFRKLSDYQGFKRGLRNLFGFDVDGVDYEEAVETDVKF